MTSKAVSAVHHPPVGLIQSLSLSYPPYIASPARLVVGKNQPTSKAPPSPSLAEPSTPSPAAKMTHRQKYEALLAATTRPAPYVLSASLAVGGIVRSDPISGKVTKGYWGPGRDANFHLRPHLDHSSPPSAVYLPPRSQTYSIWGLLIGTVVHTTIGLKSHASQGGRASSTNVVCAVDDAHEGEVRCVWAEEGGESWVTSGEDGRVKLWRLHAAPPRSGKKSPGGDIAGRVECLFTSKPPTETLENRSDVAKLRTAQRPDPVILARCDSQNHVVCGVTEDGDLRIWFDVLVSRREVRVDVGSADEGPVKRLELDLVDRGNVAVLIHHERSNFFSRFDVGEGGSVRRTDYGIEGAITALHASLLPAASISAPPASDPISVDAEENELSLPPSLSHDRSLYGRFVVIGDEHGSASIFPWDNEQGSAESGQAIRRWQVSNKKVTAIDSHCSLIAIGR